MRARTWRYPTRGHALGSAGGKAHGHGPRGSAGVGAGGGGGGAAVGVRPPHGRHGAAATLEGTIVIYKH